MQDAVLIASLKSRHGAEEFGKAREMLAERGVNVVEAHAVPNKKALVKRVRQAVKAGHKLICVACGDGGQTSVVREFAYRDAILGVIPAGTGNSFALGLGIDSVERAIDAIVAGKVASVDLGLANGSYFANFATIGVNAVVAEETPRGLKKVLGPVAYGVSAIGPMLTRGPFECRVRSKREEFELTTHQVIVANGRFYGHKPVTPDATIVDGRLAFFSTTETSKLDLVRTYLALLRGEQTDLPNARYFSAKKLRIKTKPCQLVSIDGDTLCETPVKFSVARRALRVMVPASFPRLPA